ncbi:hypothetical protein AYJ54_33735 [Bradyrhizobium centrolobii]|uniref:Uncharacterized protein n=1 Tax=Bradyrhizobium centrolobii TaxID=1505087 RepID=A0A176YAP5_9BRAD|nr:hypothetical protein [Bradyrhizobium centrolobii]OAE99005.1 hypothetical protein AYJ54_33735 [Bradyrhizobium centrolobii]
MFTRHSVPSTLYGLTSERWPTLHPRGDYGSARASRVAALDGLLSWLRGLDGVAFLTCEEVAQRLGA